MSLTGNSASAASSMKKKKIFYLNFCLRPEALNLLRRQLIWGLMQYICRVKISELEVTPITLTMASLKML